MSLNVLILVFFPAVLVLLNSPILFILLRGGIISKGRAITTLIYIWVAIQIFWIWAVAMFSQ